MPFPAMDSEVKKLEIRRRLYKAKQAADEPIDDSLAACFEECFACSGRGSICTEWIDDGVPTASLDICSSCEGDGFVPRSVLS